ncbi:MAG: hypothetical protein HYR96_03060 [Deltaproteobacteria bacterium]|nr:hypothetical protein [Deltaproteobacteria bacterium]MBI3294079.1 hypothetical protein [Deltaproteobacteria bacterium]
MARNVLPSDTPRENEVLGLIYWSINFIKVVAGCTCAIGVWQIIHAFALFGAHNSVPPFSNLAAALGFLFLGIQTFQIFRFDKAYVVSEKDESLIHALFRLGDFWLIYAATVGASLLPVTPYLIQRATGYIVPSTILIVVYVLSAAAFITLFTINLLATKRFAPPTHPIIKEVQTFARRNVDRVRLIGFFSMGVGALLVLLYSFDLLPFAPAEPVEHLMTGTAFLVVGAAITFYWRGVREIHRNPSLIYFERTLERLNLFWLLASIAFLTTLVTILVA